MTALQIKTRQPTSMATGEYSETHNPYQIWTMEIKRLMKLGRAGVLVATPYEHIDEDTRYQEDLR